MTALKLRSWRAVSSAPQALGAAGQLLDELEHVRELGHRLLVRAERLVAARGVEVGGDRLGDALRVLEVEGELARVARPADVALAQQVGDPAVALGGGPTGAGSRRRPRG